MSLVDGDTLRSESKLRDWWESLSEHERPGWEWTLAAAAKAVALGKFSRGASLFAKLVGEQQEVEPVWFRRSRPRVDQVITRPPADPAAKREQRMALAASLAEFLASHRTAANTS